MKEIIDSLSIVLIALACILNAIALLSMSKKTVDKQKNKEDNKGKGKVSFVSPVTFEERFKNAENVDDVLDHE